MKIKSFIFMFLLCALIIISVEAVRPSKDEKQSGVTEESKTKIQVDTDGGRGEGGHDGEWGGGMHSNVDWETLEQEGFGEEPEGGGSRGGGGENNEFGESGGRENEGYGGGGGGENSEYGEGGGRENEGYGGGGGGGGENNEYGEGEGKGRENEGHGGEEGERSEYEETGEYP